MHKFNTSLVVHFHILGLTSWIWSNPSTEGLEFERPSKWNSYEGFNLEHWSRPHESTQPLRYWYKCYIDNCINTRAAPLPTPTTGSGFGSLNPLRRWKRSQLCWNLQMSILGLFDSGYRVRDPKLVKWCRTGIWMNRPSILSGVFFSFTRALSSTRWMGLRKRHESQAPTTSYITTWYCV